MSNKANEHTVHSIDTPVDINEGNETPEPSNKEIDKYYDGKKPGEWNTVYCKTSWSYITVEALYVSVLLFSSFVLCYKTWNGQLNSSYLNLSLEKYNTLTLFIYCFSAGIIGGTLFAIKWLYHCVARKKWHIDRILWRIFTPWISGVFALVMYILMKSGLFSAFDASAISNSYIAFSIGFLVGYFSDSAMSKFREIADTLFGKSNS